ncbi:MAG: hypothetical protein ACYC65_04710 [Candidatus Limnocylindrales bacterium]
MPAESPGERELLERIVREDPEARAARRAHERWVTSQRLWAAIEREGIIDDGERARFIASRLWPDMPAPWVEALVTRARQGAADGRPLRRPERREDVVGPRLAALMRKHGYPTATN